MVVANGSIGQVQRRHTGNAVSEIIEGTCEIVEELPRIAGKVKTFGEIELGRPEQHAYADAAMKLRWDVGKAPVTAAQLIRARREEDRRDDLWTTFQRVQENLLKGGQRGLGSTGRRTTTRPIKSVDGDVKLNQALWTLTERMAELKGM